jgi:uncharacterized protein YceK
MKRSDLIFLAAMLASGCASMDTQTAGEQQPYEEKAVVTGSRIPTKTGTSQAVYSVDKQSAQDSMMRGGTNVPTSGGN